MSQIGRISGAVLKDNLLRDGIDLAFETDLLYLNVANRRIGLRSDAPTRDFLVNSNVLTTNLIVDTLAQVSSNTGIELRSDNSITSLTSPLTFSATSLVTANNIRTDYINFDDNVISNLVSNSNIEVRPTGTLTDFFSDLKINGNLHTTGDITFEGNITIGGTSGQSAIAVADVASDILPDVPGLTLGNENRRWADVYSRLFNGTTLEVDGVNSGGVALDTRQGKIWFVATNGTDTNTGDHEQGPFATITQALSQAENGDTVQIYPGTYTEPFPLTVPAGVAVVGASIRSCTIVPTEATNSNDAFLLNGESTVSNITVKDFYYNATNNTGYGFRFASGFKVTTRSPYVQNISVITRGSTVTIDDLRGFAAGDAGKGAYVDGSAADPTSVQASMLFHSCTFITPNADAITMLNGVRVEWLNCFTYFANRGLYALNGTAGFASQATKFGAEIRSIGSANVYGNFGAVADGASTLMYLIMHNFAYVGSGKDSSNDSTITIQASEVVRLNSGNIYFQSHNKGKMRIGDAFFVDLEKGITSIDVGSADIIGVSSITLGSGNQVTFIDPTKIDTGNLSISGNQLISRSGEVNIVAADNEINLATNIRIQNDLSVVGNLTFGGNITIGNAPTDIIDFNSEISDNIAPKVTDLYSLGSAGKQWNTVFLENLYAGNFDIYDNVIKTNESNLDLVLSAAGTGTVSVANNDVELAQNLTVQGAANITSGYLTVGNIDLTGNTVQSGDFDLTGDLSTTGIFSVTNSAGIAVQFPDIRIDNNVITTTLSNSDLEFLANGSGIVRIPFNNVRVTNQLSTGDNISAGSFSTTGVLTADQLITANISLVGNVIRTTTAPSNLIISTNGTGRIVAPISDVVIDQSLTMFTTGTTTSLKNLEVTGNIIHAGAYTQTGSSNRTGATAITGGITVGSFAQFQDIRINSNVVTTTATNSNLEFRASGLGIVRFPTNNVRFANDLAVTSAINANSLVLGGLLTANQFSTGNVLIDDNDITTTSGNLRLLANASGLVYFPSNSVEFTNNLTVLGTTNLRATNIGLLATPSTLTVLGNSVQTGGTERTGAVGITGNLTVGSDTQFGQVQFRSNFITTAAGNSNLELRANGTGQILVPTANVRAFNNLTVNGVSTLAVVNVTDTITASGFNTGDILISGNTITTTVGSNNLELRANIPGNITVSSNFVADRDLSVSTTTNLRATNITGTVTHVGDTTHTGTRTHTGSYNLSGVLTTSADAGFQNISIVNNAIRTNDSNSDLELYAAGTGQVRVPLDNVLISNNLAVAGTTAVAAVNSSGTVTADRFTVADILIEDNFITTTSGSSNLQLTGAGSGGVRLEQIKFTDTDISTDSGNTNIVLTPGTASNVVVNTTTALKVPVGTVANRPTTIPGDFRFNSVDRVFSGWNRDFGGVFSSDRRTFARATSDNIISFFANTALTLQVLPDRIWTNGVTVDNTINLTGNTIRNTVPNQNLMLEPNGVGSVIVNEIQISGSELINQNNTTPLTFSSTGDGYLKFAGAGGIVIPVGDTASQPENPEEGDFRFNSEENFAEVYSLAQQQYIPITGTGEVVTEEIMRELGDLWALILG